MAFCYLDPWKQISVKFESEYKNVRKNKKSL